jgi:uncharacterized membrane protein
VDVDIDALAEAIGQGIEAAGVVVILVGLVVSSATYLRRLRRSGGADEAFWSYRRDLGRGLLLGLEFLVAGDIIRTVATSPTFSDFGVLIAIVLIRTFLSFTLELETEGRWPWQARTTAGARKAPRDE